MEITLIIILGGFLLGTLCFALCELNRNISLTKENDRLTLDNAELSCQLDFEKSCVKTYEEMSGKLSEKRRQFLGIPIVLHDLKAKHLPNGMVAVYGQHKDLPDIIIKTIPYNPADESDSEFALREALELIETIKKA